MPVKFIETEMAGVTIVEPEIFSDHRGFFMETYHQAKYGAGGVAAAFVQDNRSHSRKGVLRGLHYQLRRPQDKLVFAVTGEIFDVVVDIRRGSPTFGRWFGTAGLIQAPVADGSSVHHAFLVRAGSGHADGEYAGGTGGGADEVGCGHGIGAAVRLGDGVDGIGGAGRTR